MLPPETQNYLTSAKEVIFLALPLLDKGHWVYIDNYYTGIQLVDYMHQRQTIVCGTAKSNRVPNRLASTKLRKGQMLALRSDHILAIKFADTKDVYMMTTGHDESTQVVHERGGQQKTKPSAVVAYNKKMGSVDKKDQVLMTFYCDANTLCSFSVY